MCSHLLASVEITNAPNKCSTITKRIWQAARTGAVSRQPVDINSPTYLENSAQLSERFEMINVNY